MDDKSVIANSQQLADALETLAQAQARLALAQNAVAQAQQDVNAATANVTAIRTALLQAFVVVAPEDVEFPVPTPVTLRKV